MKNDKLGSSVSDERDAIDGAVSAYDLSESDLAALDLLQGTHPRLWQYIRESGQAVLALQGERDAAQARAQVAERRLQFYADHFGEFDLRKNNFKTYKWHWYGTFDDPGKQFENLIDAIDAAISAADAADKSTAHPEAMALSSQDPPTTQKEAS